MATALARSGGAPATYESLFTDWSGFVRGTARKYGVPVQELDDFTSDVMLYCLEHDSLTRYRSDKATFVTYLEAYVYRRAFSFRRSLARAHYELAAGLDAPLSNDSDESATNADRYGTPDFSERVVERVYAVSATATFLDYLALHDADEPGPAHLKDPVCRGMHAFMLALVAVVLDRTGVELTADVKVTLVPSARVDVARRCGYVKKSGAPDDGAVSRRLAQLRIIAYEAGYLS